MYSHANGPCCAGCTACYSSIAGYLRGICPGFLSRSLAWVKKFGEEGVGHVAQVTGDGFQMGQTHARTPQVLDWTCPMITCTIIVFVLHLPKDTHEPRLGIE